MVNYVENKRILTDAAKAVVAMKPSRRISKLDALERALVAEALATAKGNIAAAARLLGVDRKVIERRAAKYGL